MITLSNLVNKLRDCFSRGVELRYVHPLLYIVCVDEIFAGKSNDLRYDALASKLDVSPEDLYGVVARGSLQLAMVTAQERIDEYSFLDSADSGQHWLSWFAMRDVNLDDSQVNEDRKHRAIHFYGFKGGQARSTVLVLFAKLLADHGHRVLIVDADIEAPSMDSAFDVTAEFASATLMGLSGWAEEISPLPRVYVGQTSQGTVDLIACRPRSEEFDIDFAGFLLGVTLDARMAQQAAAKLREFVIDNDLYDYVLFDHRTGLAPSVLPLMKGWPGSTVVFVRPDGMSRNLEHSNALGALLSNDSQAPGAFVSFSLDPQQTSDEFLKSHGRFVERLLFGLADAINTEEDIDPTELLRYWMLWTHDSSILGQTAPGPEHICAQNRAVLKQLVEVLGVELGKGNNTQTQVKLTNSGSTDEGLFILTPDLAKIFSLESRILYIFGRKGTGKTRLLKELVSRNLGEPLLVSHDYPSGGLQSGGVLFEAILERCGDNYKQFWWMLLLAAVRAPVFNADGFRDELKRISDMPSDDIRKVSNPIYIEQVIEKSGWGGRRVFLIDGVETAVPASKLRGFVESMFRFLATVQYSESISRRLHIRLFLRSDLHKSAAQNIEQQIDGSSVDLHWNRRAILNFCVARIHSLDWFKREFMTAWLSIDKRIEDLSRGALSEIEAEVILLQIFPSSLERNRLKTTTFFATYFSDAGGDGDNKASFYPRLFDGFLRTMNDATDHSLAIMDERLSSAFVLQAYDKASTAFIDEVRTELHNLLELAEDDASNRDAVNGLLEAFEGLRTPFVFEEMIKELVGRLSYPAEVIREAMGKMKQIGIFEDRSGYPGWWRSGRLYKSGLKMKYVRNTQ